MSLYSSCVFSHKTESAAVGDHYMGAVSPGMVWVGKPKNGLGFFSPRKVDTYKHPVLAVITLSFLLHHR